MNIEILFNRINQKLHPKKAIPYKEICFKCKKVTVGAYYVNGKYECRKCCRKNMLNVLRKYRKK